MKKALITGITGQDGSYLAEFLLGKGYEVAGFMRRSSTEPLMRLGDVISKNNIKFYDGNLRDLNSIRRVMEDFVPDEVYNLAALSDVGISFRCPEETMDVNYYGSGRIIDEAIQVNPKVRIYQASTSEMFGSTPPPQNESSPFVPVSPYAEAKLKAHENFIVGYRDKHQVFVCSGILFNHESPRRGKHFVTRKITHSLSKVKHGLQDFIQLGNLEATRDWGFAGDYVEAMWLMLQADKPDDFVIATGENHSVRDFVNATFDALDMKVTWEGKGLEEVAKDENGKIILKINEKFYRPVEVRNLCGDATKAQEKLGWKAKTSFADIVKMMVDHDEESVQKGKYFF